MDLGGLALLGPLSSYTHALSAPSSANSLHLEGRNLTETPYIGMSVLRSLGLFLSDCGSLLLKKASQMMAECLRVLLL